MALRIENGKLVGVMEKKNVQYLHGSADLGGYDVKVRIDGAPLYLIEQLIMDSAIIRSRKVHKNKAAVQALANEISLHRFISAQGASTMSPAEAVASLDPDELDDKVAMELYRKLQARAKAAK